MPVRYRQVEPAVAVDFAALSQPPGTLCVDLYGSRPPELLQQFDYCLTTRPVKAAIRHYPLKFHPLPMNVLIEEADTGSGPISLCRRDQLPARESSLKRRRAKNRLRLYFTNGPANGSSLLLLGVITLLKRLRDALRR